MTLMRHLSMACFVTVLISGCVEGGSSTDTSSDAGGDTFDTTVLQGVFLDCIVEGMRYVSGGQSGYTDANGTFRYEQRQDVTFSVGDIQIGTASGAATLTSVDLVAGATDQTHPTVYNICQFLQSIVEDGDTSNGIQISRLQDAAAEGRSIDFAQSIAEFSHDSNVLTIVAEMTAITVAGSRGLVSSATASCSGDRAPTADNFPALKNFWDMDHISGAVLYDRVGGQHVTSDSGHWYLDSEGFAKWSISGGQTLPGEYEAPGDRDFMLVGCGLISFMTRACTIGQFATNPEPEPIPAGIAFELTHPSPFSPSAFYDIDNYSGTALFSFSEQLSRRIVIIGENTHPDPDNRGVKGCFATVISPTAGTVKGYWAGRTGETASYDPGYEEITYPIAVGSIQRAWPALGAGWTMYPGNRFEWVGLLIFESGAPLDMQEAMEWMAQYNDIRLYPGWAGKK